jgi:hypothetical protein
VIPSKIEETKAAYFKRADSLIEVCAVSTPVLLGSHMYNFTEAKVIRRKDGNTPAHWSLSQKTPATSPLGLYASRRFATDPAGSSWSRWLGRAGLSGRMAWNTQLRWSSSLCSDILDKNSLFDIAACLAAV